MKYKQLRLLLPPEWFNDLNTLANARCTSRLALLRHYIREKMLADLVQMKSDIARWTTTRGTAIQIKQLSNLHKSYSSRPSKSNQR